MLQQIRSVAKIFDITVMTFESSIKIYNTATAKIFVLADMDFDLADMMFDVPADLDFDLADMDFDLADMDFDLTDMIFDLADMDFDLADMIFDLADMVFDSVPDRKFGLRHQEIRPCIMKKFDPAS
jgi:hypothetical protein